MAEKTSKIGLKNVKNSRKKTSERAEKAPKIAGETSKTSQLSLKAQRKSWSVNTQLAASDQKNTITPTKSKKHMSIVLENKDIRGLKKNKKNKIEASYSRYKGIRADFFFVFDPEQE